MRGTSLRRLGLVAGLAAALASSTVVLAAETGSISGTVTDSSGAALAGICVAATSGAEPPFGLRQSETDTSGAFRLDGVPAGPAKVSFERCPYDDRNLRSQYFDGKPDRASADAVTVVAGEVITGVDARMRPGGVITGRLSDSSGRPLRTACAAAYPEPAPGATSVEAPVDRRSAQGRGARGPGDRRRDRRAGGARLRDARLGHSRYWWRREGRARRGRGSTAGRGGCFAAADG